MHCLSHHTLHQFFFLRPCGVPAWSMSPSCRTLSSTTCNEILGSFSDWHAVIRLGYNYKFLSAYNWRGQLQILFCSRQSKTSNQPDGKWFVCDQPHQCSAPEKYTEKHVRMFHSIRNLVVLSLSVVSVPHVGPRLPDCDKRALREIVLPSFTDRVERLKIAMYRHVCAAPPR